MNESMARNLVTVLDNCNRINEKMVTLIVMCVIMILLITIWIGELILSAAHDEPILPTYSWDKETYIRDQLGWILGWPQNEGTDILND